MGEDLILLREFSAANAHVAAFGESGMRYEEAASHFNANPSVSQSFTWKTVRNCYKRRQAQFYKTDNASQRLSSVGGEIEAMEELLMAMRQARDFPTVTNTAKKNARQETDRKKEMIGQALVEMSLVAE